MNFRSSCLSLAILFMAAVSVQVHGQVQPGAAAWSEWETIRPEGEEFNVLMPKNSSAESEKFPYHKMELTGRLYLSSIPNGPTVAVASFSGIKTAAGSDFERFNSYVDAFKNWFPGKVRGKDAVAKMVQVGTKMFHGYSGREYKLTIADLNGVAQAYATRKRFYVLVSLNTKKDDELENRFLSSFVLPDKPVEERQVTATQGNTAQVETAPARPNPEMKRTESSTSSAEAATQTSGEVGATTAVDSSNNPSNPSDSTQSKPKRPPISGGMLNGKAIYLPLPEAPAGQATGVVMVQVMIDEEGAVVEARAISGPSHLQAAAVNAARLARFSPTMLMGEPVRVTGTISYNFTKAN